MPKSAKLGQNFLRDGNIAARIIDLFLTQAAGGTLQVPTPRSCGGGGPSRPAQTGPVLEIGAGPGILSELLLAKVPAERVTLVEFDRFLAGQLKERFGDPPRIIQEDILGIDLLRLYPEGHVAVIGNLPYHISKELVDWLMAQRAKIGLAVLMLQKDFIDKLLAPPGGKNYHAQSVAFQLLFQARRCFNVPAGAFVPQPRIVSTVIAAQPRKFPLPDAGAFYAFVKSCFAERRKTLWNNLASHFSRAALSALAAASGLPATARAEQLPAERFVALFSLSQQCAREERK